MKDKESSLNEIYSSDKPNEEDLFLATIAFRACGLLLVILCSYYIYAGKFYKGIGKVWIDANEYPIIFWTLIVGFGGVGLFATFAKLNKPKKKQYENTE